MNATTGCLNHRQSGTTIMTKGMNQINRLTRWQEIIWDLALIVVHVSTKIFLHNLVYKRLTKLIIWMYGYIIICKTRQVHVCSWNKTYIKPCTLISDLWVLYLLSFPVWIILYPHQKYRIHEATASSMWSKSLTNNPGVTNTNFMPIIRSGDV